LADEQETALRYRALKNALATLKPRERCIFTARRLTDKPPPKLGQLAAEYGISRERVRQIELRAFQKIKAAIEATTERPVDCIISEEAKQHGRRRQPIESALFPDA
jgi:RNA polymerase sigma-32 factor